MDKITYTDAGVSIDSANRATERIKELARTTFNKQTLSEIGTFGGMFDCSFPGLAEPVLVASADGVGTKLKVAIEANIHNTVGQDLVNHCVNDILVQGARPLFFMDYIATGKLDPEIIASIIDGIVVGCRANGCVLLGGETAEMPGFYSNRDYDIAGFIVGVVDRKKIIDGKGIREDDTVLALRSSGLHTNGYSLARKLFFEVAGYKINTRIEEIGQTIGEALLSTHKSYLNSLAPLLDKGYIKGLAHITGGGLLENIPRILPNNTSVEIKTSSWTVPALFSLMQQIGNVDRDEMYRTFNMGIGMVIICSRQLAREVQSGIAQTGEECIEIGKVISGNRQVILK
jgi:phosphoribosylformylglycinamidine cyclo-ligase